MIIRDNFSYFSLKCCDPSSEPSHMRDQNIDFYVVLTKLSQIIFKYSLISRVL